MSFSAIYKCRHCNEKTKVWETKGNRTDAMGKLVHILAVDSLSRPEQVNLHSSSVLAGIDNDSLFVYLTPVRSVHYCDDGSVGITDLCGLQENK